ncbi:uncharacterized protein [Hetaerina americana]|uniref:uncharacterized protein n=1 Tax=Hetaerina americana TaxID=62018 RepID=UPI003A7F484F
MKPTSSRPHSAERTAVYRADGMASRGLFTFTLFWTLALVALVGHDAGFVDGASHGISPPSENCFARNLYSSLMFKCKRPQARAFRSSEVIGELIEEGDYIKPCMAVLHRCDSSSGCCMQKEGMSCAPKEIDIVRLDFKIRPKFSRSERLISILARNHTACECIDEELVREEKIAVKAFIFHTTELENKKNGFTQVHMH